MRQHRGPAGGCLGTCRSRRTAVASVEPRHIGINAGGNHSATGIGTEVTFKERVAGIKGQARGTVTQRVPGTLAEWEGRALYLYLGFPLRVCQDVSWRVERADRETRLSARVWAEFAPALAERFFEWYAKAMLNVVERDREHARRELKSAIDSIKE
jgi:hypothetical protein